MPHTYPSRQSAAQKHIRQQAGHGVRTPLHNLTNRGSNGSLVTMWSLELILSRFWQIGSRFSGWASPFHHHTQPQPQSQSSYLFSSSQSSSSRVHSSPILTHSLRKLWTPCTWACCVFAVLYWRSYRSIQLRSSPTQPLLSNEVWRYVYSIWQSTSTGPFVASFQK